MCLDFSFFPIFLYNLYACFYNSLYFHDARMMKRLLLCAFPIIESIGGFTCLSSTARHSPVAFHSRSLAASSSRGQNEEEIIKLQRSVSKSNKEETATVSTNENDHLIHQAQVFDNISEWFADRDKEVTPELEPIYESMADEILSKFISLENETEDDKGVHKILDVACGTGVLWEFLIKAADQSGVGLDITGVDLSPSMVDHARRRAEDLSDEKHKVKVVESDILAFCQNNDIDDDSKINTFDGTILNACFGNFWDPAKVLKTIPGNVICISHPLGSTFVQKLHSEDPRTVPHVLPESPLDVVKMIHGSPLVLSSDMVVNKPFYLTTIERCRAKGLENVHRYRGCVDQGYGRGGKKLGVPTANLPASLFQNALEDVSTGVYFGWTALETHPDRIFKAVVNVGYSPTFEGQENPEKIIEAHLILEEDTKLDDFYGTPMRLQLIGFLRNERKFDSFPELVAQINADIQDAKAMLDKTPYQELKADPFLKTSSNWIGTDGGDETASWEFKPMMDLIQIILSDKE